MRMADADMLPFQFTDLADTVHVYVADLKKLAATARDKAKERNTEISEGVYKALYDPKKQFVPPTTQPLPPYLNFAPLDQASDDLTRAADEYEKAVTAAGDNLPPAVNEQLIQTERMLIDSGRATQSTLVRKPDLCPRLLHWIRREDDARSPRGD